MFNTPFSHDPFRRLPIPAPFSYANYLVPQSHLPSRPPPHHRTHRYRPSFYTDADSHPSDQDDIQDDPYYMDNTNPSDNPFPDRPTHRRRRQWTSDTTPTPTFPHLLGIDSEFRRTSVRVPRKTADKLERDAILILPSTLTRLRVHIRSPYSGGGGGATDALHVVVAGDMRFRDVVRQLIGSRMQGQGEVRAFVRMRGAWVEPGAARVSEVVEQGRWVVDERGEVEVKIEVGGGSGGVEKEGRERGRRGIKAWERETGMAWVNFG